MMVENISPEIKQLFDIIIELNIARKNVLSYPNGHPLIEASLDKTLNLLNNFLSAKNEITIGVAKDNLIVGEEYLDKKNPVFKDFAVALYKKGIASVTFTYGFSREGFVKFHDMISSEPGPEETFKDIVDTTKKFKAENIKIKVIDYRAFRLIEEKRHNAQRKADQLWDTFIRAFLEDTLEFLDYAEDEEDSITLTDMSPAVLADELNRKSEEITPSVFDKTITKYLDNLGEGREERKIKLARLTEFLNNLTPELKEQAISSTLEYLSEKTDLAESIFSEFPEDLIVDILETISKKDSYVPPLILGLLQKLADSGEESGDPSLRWGSVERETLGDLSENELKETLKSVFEEDSIPSNYRDTLTRLISTIQTFKTDRSIEELNSAIGKDNIEGAVANIILAVIKKDTSDEEFSKLVGKLKELSEFFLETGQFNVLAETYDTLASFIESENEIHAKVSHEAIQCFSETDFMEEVVNGFNLWEKEKYEDISILIKKVGTGFIPLLLEAISKEKDAGKKNFLVEFISSFGAVATSEAMIRLEDSDPYFIRKFLVIIRQTNDRNLIQAVQRFVRHNDPKIHIEALRTLLRFEAPDASSLLRDSILSKSNEISKPAIFLAGVYKVNETLDLLLDILLKGIFWGFNSEKREACIKALGEIRNLSALPELDKIIKSNGLFNRKSLKKLKMSIIRSMAKYPLNEAKTFLETQSVSGRLKDDDLQKECTDTLNKIIKMEKTQNG